MRLSVFKMPALALAIGTTFALGACGSNSSNEELPQASASASASSSPGASASSAASESNGKPVELTFATYNAWWNLPNLQLAIQMYEEETGNKIVPQIYPDDQFMNVIKAKLATGDTPDVFAFNPSVKDFAPDQLAPLEGDWIAALDPERAVVNGYARSGDSNVYVAPFGSTSFMGLMYNKEVVKKAGVSVPIKTYEEMIAALEKVKALGVTPLTVPNKEAWTAQILVFAGSHYIAALDPDYGKNVYEGKLSYEDEPNLVEMFTRISKLKGQGFLNEDIASSTMPMAEQALSEGTTAFVAGGNWLYSDFAANYPDSVDNIGMTAFSWGDDAANLGVYKSGSGNGLYIPAQSKQKEAAMDFINFVMSDRVMKAMYEKVPGANDVGIDTEASPWDKEMQALIDNGIGKVMDSFDQAPPNYKPGTGFETGNMGETGQLLLAGKDPVKALQDMYADMVKKNKAKGFEGF